MNTDGVIWILLFCVFFIVGYGLYWLFELVCYLVKKAMWRKPWNRN